MRIAIRVDASTEIGTGHFTRCLCLADALKIRGARIRFVSRQLPAHLQRSLASAGHEFFPLSSIPVEPSLGETAHAQWLGTSQQADARETSEILADVIWDWLIVDHYALDARWESALRRVAKNIFAIDDIADRKHDCDLLLDQNLYFHAESRYTGKVPPGCELLLGPRYALLREEFSMFHGRTRPRTGPVKRALIFFGGVDTQDYTGRVVDTLGNIAMSAVHVDVVIGTQYALRRQLESKCVKYGFSLHIQTARMAELVMAADLAIGAGGSAIWERCCLGLPTLSFSVADNQKEQVADAALSGLLYAPEVEGEFGSAIQCHVRALMENYHLRYVISRNGMEAVDGCGLLRVMERLISSAIEIRTANLDDSAMLFSCRNHPTIRAVSRNSEIVDWESHQRWFNSVLIATDRVLLIGQRGDSPVGVVRFDIQGDEAEVSIYLVPDDSGKHTGQGRNLLKSAEQWFAANRPSIKKLRGYVLGHNERSRRLFAGAGYQVEAVSYIKKLHQ